METRRAQSTLLDTPHLKWDTPHLKWDTPHLKWDTPHLKCTSPRADWHWGDTVQCFLIFLRVLCAPVLYPVPVGSGQVPDRLQGLCGEDDR
jgi:hypothetical protein